MSTPASAAVPSKWSIAAALLCLYAVWGSTYFALKGVLREMAPLWASGSRYLVAGGLLLAWAAFKKTPLPSLRAARNAAWVGLLLGVGGNGGVTLAQSHGVSSGLAATLVAVMPLWTALWSRLFGEGMRWLEWLGMLMGTAGVVVLTYDGSLRAAGSGLWFALAAPLCWGLGSVLSRRMELPKGSLGPGVQLFFAGACMVALGLARGESMAVAVSPKVLALWLYLVLGGSVLAYSAYMFLLRSARPAVATSYAYVNPAVAVGLGYWLGGEPFSPQLQLALPLIVLGVAMVLWGRR